MSLSNQDAVDGLDREYANDCFTSSIVEATLSLTTTPQLVKTGGSTLANRKGIFIRANSINTFIGPTTSCLTALEKGRICYIPCGTLDYYIKVSSATGSAVIQEGA